MTALRTSGRSRVACGVHYGAGTSVYERHWVAFGWFVSSPGRWENWYCKAIDKSVLKHFQGRLACSMAVPEPTEDSLDFIAVQKAHCLAIQLVPPFHHPSGHSFTTPPTSKGRKGDSQVTITNLPIMAFRFSTIDDQLRTTSTSRFSHEQKSPKPSHHRLYLV